ncbi:hypothetical protein HHK36_019181 [Tetracentron sinense]|uniref:Uncharacterized protein n=1 Tax=Tetracentron sinense TaxID=13715 RepID=A0A835DCI9_TETSI|nr:hypothetical protein HHK36_019181 [Tetracentron sinense]
MQSVLVGEDLHGCAFVYGSLSFLDKISCGIALYVLESYQVWRELIWPSLSFQSGWILRNLLQRDDRQFQGCNDVGMLDFQIEDSILFAFFNMDCMDSTHIVF